ncbi:hypothetical protein [Clostridium botulinum]|nr:hypothetical protein [Clostridium botulinum]
MYQNKFDTSRKKGANTVVEAVNNSKLVAENIDKYLRKKSR